MRLFTVLLLIVVFFSCRDNTPKDKLGPQKMEAVMWDFIRAEIITRDFISRDSSRNLDSANVALQKKIFQAHNVKREDFYESLDHYLANSNSMSLLMDSIVARQTRSKNQKSRINILKDSVR